HRAGRHRRRAHRPARFLTPVATEADVTALPTGRAAIAVIPVSDGVPLPDRGGRWVLQVGAALWRAGATVRAPGGRTWLNVNRSGSRPHLGATRSSKRPPRPRRRARRSRPSSMT